LNEVSLARASGWRNAMGTPEFYEIRIEGHLGSSWSDWLEGMRIQHEEDGQTVLSGPLADQAALHGVLMRIRDLGLPLVAVKRSTASPSATSTASTG
jgi:hypothetical protein